MDAQFFFEEESGWAFVAEAEEFFVVIKVLVGVVVSVFWLGR